MLCVIQEYETVMKGLDRNAPSVPPQNSPQEAQQVEMWKKYIQWEKSNPLRTEDQTLITKRGDYLCSGCAVLEFVNLCKYAPIGLGFQ